MYCDGATLGQLWLATARPLTPAEQEFFTLAANQLALVWQNNQLYRQLAGLINRFRVNCHRLYTFNMDEYADEDGNIAPETWPNSFLFNMKHNFYARLDPALRPPESQSQGPSNANFKDYGKMLADLAVYDIKAFEQIVNSAKA